MNVLGIDYGSRRIGLAYADTSLGVAVPIPAAVEGAEDARIEHIAREVKMRLIHAIVVGYPFNMDGSESQKMREVDAFCTRITALWKLPVYRCDERLSSFQAEQDMAFMGGGRKNPSVSKRVRKRRSGDIDSRAASLILQSWLDERDGATDGDSPVPIIGG